MSLLLGQDPFQKFVVVGGGWWWWAFKSSALVQTLDLDLKLDQAEQFHGLGLVIKIGLVSELVLHQRSSHIKSCLPSIVFFSSNIVFHQVVNYSLVLPMCSRL